MYSTSENRMRMRIYNCFNDVRLHHNFAHMVVAPTQSADRKPRVDWTRFHATTSDDASATKQPALGNLGSCRSGARSDIRRANSSARRTGSSLGSPTESGAFPGVEGEEGDDGAPPRKMSLFSAPAEEYETSAMTYEGGNLHSMLPHLNPQSTFNRREGQLLAQHSLNHDKPRESFYEGSSDDFRRGCSEPPRRAHSSRASLPAAWRGLRGSTPVHAVPEAGPQRRISEEPSSNV